MHSARLQWQWTATNYYLERLFNGYWRSKSGLYGNQMTYCNLMDTNQNVQLVSFNSIFCGLTDDWIELESWKGVANIHKNIHLIVETGIKKLNKNQ